MFEERSLSNTKELLEKIVGDLQHLEDLTNYDVKDISKCVNILQGLDLEEEFKKTNGKN